MLRISAGLATCLAAVVTVGCGTAPTPGTSTAGPADAGSSSGCQGPAPARPATKILVITLADNAKTHCVRVGDTLHVSLRGTDSDPWLRPLVNGNALVAIPDAVTARAVTSASFAAVRSGRVTMTSVRPPCQVAVSSAKNELEPAFPLPRTYPLRSCPPGQRFSTLVIVRALGAADRSAR